MKEKTKFMPTITCSAKLRKQKEYEFEFTKEEKIKGLEATFDKPYFVGDASRVFALYKDNQGNLAINYFISYKGFIELKPGSETQTGLRIAKKKKTKPKQENGKNE